MRPGFDNKVTIQVDLYLIVEVDLSIKAYQKGEILPLSKKFLNDTRQLETILSKCLVYLLIVLAPKIPLLSHLALLIYYLQKIISNKLLII